MANIDENKDGSKEICDAAIVVVDGPGVAYPDKEKYKKTTTPKKTNYSNKLRTTQQTKGHNVNEDHWIDSLTIKWTFKFQGKFLSWERIV